MSASILTFFLFLFVNLLWAALHYYLWRRITPASWPKKAKRRRGVLVFVISLCLSAPFTLISGLVLPATSLVNVLRTFAYTMVGLSSALIVFVFCRDLLWWGARGVEKLSSRRRGSREALLSPARRSFIFDTSSLGVTAAAVTCVGAGAAVAAHRPEIRHVSVPIRGLHPGLDGLRIAQLSDVHVGPTISGAALADMVARINELAPDLVVITGDLVDGRLEELGDQIEPLAKLKATHGTYFCTGNHEYLWDGPAWSEHVARQGVTVLNNAHEVVDHQGARLLVAGVTDLQAERVVPAHATNPEAALTGAPRVDFKLLLAHQPESRHAASAAGFDLQLSGHTHGGQFFPFNVLVHLALPISAGLHMHHEMTLFVSTGAGYWGPPNRLGVPSEIPILTLRTAEAARSIV